MRTQFGRMGRAMARCHVFLSFPHVFGKCKYPPAHDDFV